MKKEEQFEVRDMRSKEKFFIHDEYLNGYARLCGANATLVYLCLCRHADRHQESFPSVQMMAEKLNLSRDSVMRGIKALIQWNIISKERERKADKTWLNNRYVLLDKSVWKSKPSSSEQHGGIQVANQGKSQVAVSDTKDTHRIKDTHKTAAPSAGTLGNEVINLFKDINPSYQQLFKRKQQHEAAERLVTFHGFEKSKRAVEFLVSRRADQYCPTIISPTQLEEKWGALEKYWLGLQSGAVKNNTRIWV